MPSIKHGGKRNGAGRPVVTEPRALTLQVRLTESESATLDARRGASTRSDFVRALILAVRQ